MILIHKENDKENLINYRLVSLLPIRGEIFERCLGFLRKTNLFYLINPVLNVVIPV